MDILEWIKAHDTLLALLGGLGILIFVGSLIAIPVIIAYMPEDYFVRVASHSINRSPLRRLLQALKNLFGSILLLSGLLLLLLPGQGIITIVIGLSLIDFPGKHQLQIRLIRQPKIRQSIQWIRTRVHHKPLLIP